MKKSILFFLSLAAVLQAAPPQFGQSSISFGTVTTGASSQRSITLSNPGDEPLVLEFIEDSAGELSVSPSTLTLAAGGSASVTVSFSPEHNLAYSGMLVAGGSAGAAGIPWTGSGDYTGTTWDSTYNLWGSALKAQLLNLIDDESVIGYDNARAAMFGDIDNVNGWVEGVYTGFMLQTSGIPDHTVMNTEHTWPQSYGAEGDARSDLHHLFPSKSTINTSRGNLPFGEVVVSSSGYPQSGADRGTNSSGVLVFEPRLQHKGDCARAVFYFALRWGNRESFLNLANQETVLRGWHTLDPPDTWEINRNVEINSYQHNLNPFVAQPGLLDRIASFTGSADFATSAEFSLWPDDSLLLGSCSAGTAYDGLVLANPGTATLSITSWNVSPSCFTLTGMPTSITAGQSVSPTVTPLEDCGETPAAVLTVYTSAGSEQIVLGAQLGTVQPPEPSTDLRVTTDGTLLYFSWDAIDDAVVYRLDHADTYDGPWTPVTITPSLSLNVNPGTAVIGFYRIVGLH